MPAPRSCVGVRSPSGTWTSTTVGRKSDHHTRAIVELDEVGRIIHVFATSPESGGVIYEKTSPMGSVAFPAGKGTPVMKNADGELNNATSTKQNVSPATGLVVLASGQQVYFHQYFSLGGGGGGVAPTASFSASPTSGTAPLTVQFTDTSTGGPTSWEWDFQNDGTVDLAVGTHALIQESLELPSLGLAVVDEQHRFGVNQRRALDRKAPAGLAPHVLHMTATPIPRTLSLTAYGDLDADGDLDRRHQRNRQPSVEGLKQPPDEPHIVVGRQPDHHLALGGVP
jgi:hypothetical protein